MLGRSKIFDKAKNNILLCLFGKPQNIDKGISISCFACWNYPTILNKVIINCYARFEEPQNIDKGILTDCFACWEDPKIHDKVNNNCLLCMFGRASTLC